MASQIKIDYTNFVENYEVRNGYVGSSSVLNAAVDKLKQEVDALYGFLRGGSIAGVGNVTSENGDVVNEVVGAAQGKSLFNTQIPVLAAGTGRVATLQGEYNTGINNVQTLVVRSVDQLHKEVFSAGTWGAL